MMAPGGELKAVHLGWNAELMRETYPATMVQGDSAIESAV